MKKVIVDFTKILADINEMKDDKDRMIASLTFKQLCETTIEKLK